MEFHPFQNCVASWLNGSHYRCCGVCEDHQDQDYDLIRPSKAENSKSETELVVCLIKHHKTLCIRLFYTHRVDQRCTCARSPLRSGASQQGQLHDFMCLTSFKLSTLWLVPAGGSSPAKVANTIEFHPEIRGSAFPQRPSCRVRPVSGGRGRSYSSLRRRRPQPAAPGPPPGGPP